MSGDGDIEMASDENAALKSLLASKRYCPTKRHPLSRNPFNAIRLDPERVIKAENGVAKCISLNEYF